METSLIKILTEAGAIGLAILAILILYKLASDHICKSTQTNQKLADNVYENTQATKEMAKVMSEFKELLKRHIKI